MFEKIMANFALHVELSEEEKMKIADVLQTQKIPKGAHLLESGKICRHLYFVDKGCLRTIYTDKSGIEHNLLLHPENWWAGDPASFSTQKKSSLSISALEPTEITLLSYTELERLYIEIPKLERFFRILFLNGFSYYQKRLTNILSFTAEERYRIFIKQYPDLEQRISQKHIASFLGMTPVFLSMLRKKR